jgi:ABC-type transporter Mla subunit MlaD
VKDAQNHPGSNDRFQPRSSFSHIRETSQHQLQVKTYFGDARGLRTGAPVRVAGVDLGRVDVHVRPELKTRAAKIILLIQTPYELKIPDDSVVSLRRGGLLGEMYAEVDIRHASGPPSESRRFESLGRRRPAHKVKTHSSTGQANQNRRESLYITDA